jgi:hypothetical protein
MTPMKKQKSRLRTSSRSCAAFACLLIVLSGAPTSVRAAASRAETFEWLKNQLTQIVQYEYENVRYTRVLVVTNISDCRLVFTDKIDSRDRPSTFEYKLQFSNLDTNHHEIVGFAPGIWSLYVPARSGRYVVDVTANPPIPCGSSPCRDQKMNGITFFFNDHALAKRASRALQHATALCGGKSDPF